MIRAKAAVGGRGAAAAASVNGLACRFLGAANPTELRRFWNRWLISFSCVAHTLVERRVGAWRIDTLGAQATIIAAVRA